MQISDPTVRFDVVDYSRERRVNRNRRVSVYLTVSEGTTHISREFFHFPSREFQCDFLLCTRNFFLSVFIFYESRYAVSLPENIFLLKSDNHNITYVMS